MELYIHVPFCKQKCHYCGFYSEPLGVSVSQTHGILAKGAENLLPCDIGTNLFSAPKKQTDKALDEELLRSIIQRKFDGETSENLANDVVKNFFGDNAPFAQKNSTQNTVWTQKNTGTKESLKKKKLLNSSKAFGTHPIGVQSLADILKNQKKTHITEKETQQVTGATLGDALLSKAQARDLRKSFGLPDREEAQSESLQDRRSKAPIIKLKSPQNPTSLASLLIPSMTAQQLINPQHDRQNNPMQIKEVKPVSKRALQSMQSLIAGDNTGFVDMETANDYVRIAQNGISMHQEEITRMPVPLALPVDFQEKNELSQNSSYQLWKKTLLLEIKIFAQDYASKFANETVTSIFFGGGTPSFIPVKDMNLILRTLIKNFPVTQKAEITLEANPESINLEKARAYFQSGFNRVSLGVQSLQDENLHSLGRVHSSISAIKAFHILREARFNNISIDLMWGLPNQKNRMWRADIKEAINLAPEHISCYGLSIDEDTYFSELEEKGELVLPEEKEQALMYRSCVELLEDAGYLQYEISNFSKMGYPCKHNMGYWQGENYLGFGPSAASTVNGIRQTHARSLVEWAKDVQYGHVRADNFSHLKRVCTMEQNAKKDALDTKNLPALQNKQAPYFTKEILSHQDSILECIMLRLRTTKGLSFAEYKKLTQRSFMSDHKNLIQALVQKNLVRVKNGSISLSSSGMLISNSILERFFERTKKLLGKNG